MAMDLLQASVDRSVIALWLGHEHVETTRIYLEATLAMKEKALAKTSSPDGTPGPYKPGDRLLAFLNGLYKTRDYVGRFAEAFRAAIWNLQAQSP